MTTSAVESRIHSLGGSAFREETLTRRVPTVFVALGGSGKDVVMRLRKRFFDRFQTKDPGFARFVFIDTDTQSTTPLEEKDDSYAELAPNQDELVDVPINPAQFEKTFHDLNAKVNCEHLSWLKLEMERITPQAVAHGAGTYRPMGRLAFYLNYTAIRATLEYQIEAALRFAAEDAANVDDSRVEVVILMSLAGGTGAGMFIDVAYLVKDILNQPRYQTLSGKNITLIGFLPGVFEDQKPLYERLQQNAFAAFLELEHYGTPRTGDELFLGDLRDPAGQSNQNWTGFRKNWGDGQVEFIRGPGWDTCFLIDNRNDLDPNAPLTRREVFQMAADYLFLDFENHAFAVAKRSARCNLVQFKDKVKETWVRRGDNGRPAAPSLIEGDSVYATQNGCRFSTFGVAEIFFDVERLYYVASYRLAARLLRQRWLGSAERFTQGVYTNWVKEDLLQPRARPDEETPPSFLPESMIRRMLTGANGCHLDELTRDFASLAEVRPSEGRQRLTQALRNHAVQLQEGQGRRGDRGPALQTLQESLTKLGGDPGTLGPLRKRLRELAASRCAGVGVNATLQLLDKYRDAIGKVRDRAREQTRPASPDDGRLLARLIEAESVPWPVRDKAIAIEFARARDQAAEAVKLRYEKHAAARLDELLQGISLYIGTAAQTPDPGLARHGTLYGHYTRGRTLFLALATRLEDRFEVSFLDGQPQPDGRGDRGQPSRASRRHSLSPNWDRATYDMRIVEALVGHPELHLAERTAEDEENFDWDKLTELVLQKLRALGRGQMDGVRNIDDLIKYYITNGLDDASGIVQAAEKLAEACRIVLHGAKDATGQHAGGFQLRDEGGGNAIDLLVRQDNWEELLDKMVKASMPYIQTTDPTRISSDFSPAYSNLYSQKQGDAAPSANNANRVYQKVRNLVAQRATNIPNPSARLLNPPLASENSTIILVREMTGFPLQFYAHLGQMKAAYDKTISRIGNLGNDVAHINFNEAGETLPDITLLDANTYAQIRDHVSFVIRAIIIGVINWRDHVLRVGVPDIHGGKPSEMRLGTRLHRAIKYACDTDRVRRYLVQAGNDWVTNASTGDWACLYASARMTWEQLKPERDVTKGEVSSPLRNCYESILSLATNRLNATEEGKRWFSALRPDPFDPPRPDDPPDLDVHGTLAQKLIRRCLRRLNPEVPIYQIFPEKLGDLAPPA